MLFALVPMRLLGKGPTEMPDFAPSGHNTSIFAYPETEHGRDVYYNEYGDLDDGEPRPACVSHDRAPLVCHGSHACENPALVVRWSRTPAAGASPRSRASPVWPLRGPDERLTIGESQHLTSGRIPSLTPPTCFRRHSWCTEGASAPVGTRE
jgi:hypothetical protein